jgi:magnesium-transporting ATPase (P-type)
MTVFFIVLWSAGWTYGAPIAVSGITYLQASTACLITIVVMQAANVLLCRSADRSIVATGMRGNPLILCGIAVGIGLAAAITYVPVLNVFFGTAPVGREAWMMMLPFAAALIALEELRKAIVRRRARRSGAPR